MLHVGRCRPRPSVRADDRRRACQAARSQRRRGALRRHRRARRRFVHHRRGPDPRADRAQRRRQDDAVQLRQPALHAQSRRHPVRGPLDAGASGAPHRRDRHRPHLSEPGAVRAAIGASTMCGSAATRKAAAISSATRCACPGCAARKRTLDRDRLVAARSCSTSKPSRTARPTGLPLGTRKRVELARALAARPEAAAARRAGGRPQPRARSASWARSSAGYATSVRSRCCWSSIT